MSSTTDSPSSTPASTTSTTTAVLLVLAALAGLLFAPALESPFLGPAVGWLADGQRLSEGPLLESATSAPQGSVLARAPLAAASFALSHRLGLDAARDHRLVSLGLHILSAWFLFFGTGALIRLLDLPRPTQAAAVTAALWTVHPLAASAVLYLEHRPQQLATTFALAALAAAFGRLRGGSPALSPLAGGALALAVIDLPLALFVPIAILVVDVATSGRGPIAVATRRPGLHSALAIGWAVALLRTRATPLEGTDGLTTSSPTLFEMMAMQGQIAWESFVRTFLPWPLSAVREVSSTAPMPWLLVTVTLALVAVVVAFRTLVLRRAAGTEPSAAKVSAVALFAIASTLIAAGWPSAMSRIGNPHGVESLGLLATAILLRVTVAFSFGLAARSAMATAPTVTAAPRSEARLPMVAVAAAVVAMLALGTLTFLRLGEFESRESLWRQAVTAQPHHSTARLALARSLEAEGRRSEAEQALRRWTATQPANPTAWMELGVYLSRSNDSQGALEAFDQARLLAPEDPALWNNLGTALLAQGDQDEALQAYEKALALDPRIALSHFHRANVLLQLDRLDEAMVGYRDALAAEPLHRGAAYNLAVMLLRQEREEEALPILEDLSRRFPEDRQINTAYVALRMASGDVRQERPPALGSAPLFDPAPSSSSSSGISAPNRP